ncbi:TetR/AcrR family transcriptional regulator [Williamsia sp. R60]
MTQDGRVIKTRQRLCKAAIELLQTKDSKDVSISELARAADVSRPTVYQHYPDLRDLYSDALSAHLESVISPEPADLDSVTPPTTLLNILSEFAAHRVLYRRLVRASASVDGYSSGSPLQPLMNALLPKIAQRVDSADPKMVDDIARYVAYGSVGVLASWLADDNGPDEDVETFGRRLWSLIRTSLNAVH